VLLGDLVDEAVDLLGAFARVRGSVAKRISLRRPGVAVGGMGHIALHVPFSLSVEPLRVQYATGGAASSRPPAASVAVDDPHDPLPSQAGQPAE